MAYKLKWEPHGVYWKYSGKVSGEEIIQASTSIYGDSRFDDLRYKLVDFLEAEAVDIDEKQVDIIAHQHMAAAISNPHIKTAIVSEEDLVMAARFVANLSASPWEVRLFHNLDAANSWLGRQPPG